MMCRAPRSGAPLCRRPTHRTVGRARKRHSRSSRRLLGHIQDPPRSEQRSGRRGRAATSCGPVHITLFQNARPSSRARNVCTGANHPDRRGGRSGCGPRRARRATGHQAHGSCRTHATSARRAPQGFGPPLRRGAPCLSRARGGARPTEVRRRPQRQRPAVRGAEAMDKPAAHALSYALACLKNARAAQLPAGRFPGWPIAHPSGRSAPRNISGHTGSPHPSYVLLLQQNTTPK